MRIMHLIKPEMKHKILPICLQENYGDSLGELIIMSFGMLWADRVKTGVKY